MRSAVRSPSYSASVSEQDLLDELLPRMPQQPAAAYWRSVELCHLIGEIRRTGGLPGLGLDLGCGDGTVMSTLSHRFKDLRVVGVDSDPAEAALAMRTGAYERVHVADGSRIPEPPDTFDWVIANSVLEHIPEPGPVLAEATRLLKPGGRLWITVPGPDFHAALAGPGMLGALLGRGEEYYQRLDRRLQHLRYWSAGEWSAHMLRYGLQVTHHSDYMPSADARRWELMSSLTAGLTAILFGGNRTNLAIQRALGVSTGSGWTPFLVAPARALVFASKLRAIGLTPERYAGLLVVARRTTS